MALDWKLELAAGSPGAPSLDITPYVIPDAINVFWGQRDSGPTARIAQAGSLRFTADNSETGLNGIGTFSPDKNMILVYRDIGGYLYGWKFEIGLAIEFLVTRDNWSTYVAKRFYITDIVPIPGRWRERTVEVTCTDFIGKFANQKTSNLTVLANKRTDEALTALMALCPVAPKATHYSTGLDTFPLIFHDINGKTSILNAAQRLMQSDMGYLFADWDDADGEDLIEQTRQTRLAEPIFTTFDDSMEDLSLRHGEQDIYNYVSVKTHPANNGSGVEVLWTLQREQSLNPQQTLVIEATYRDPGAGARSVCLSPGTEVTPVTPTDFTMFSGSGGTGSNISTDLVITVAWHASKATISLHNDNASAGYVNLLQLRGVIVRLYDVIESISQMASSKLQQYGEHDLSFDMPYQDNPNTGQAFADYLRNRWGMPATNVESVGFNPNGEYIKIEYLLDESGEMILDEEGAPLLSRTVIDYEDVFINARLGKRIELRETVTGINNSYWINGFEINIIKNQFSGRFFLERATAGIYWLLGTAGYSELGKGTTLGF